MADPSQLPQSPVPTWGIIVGAVMTFLSGLVAIVVSFYRGRSSRGKGAPMRETTPAQANEIAHRCTFYRAELDRLLSEYFA